MTKPQPHTTSRSLIESVEATNKLFGIDTGYTQVPTDALRRIAAIPLAVKHWRSAKDILQDLENQQQLEDTMETLTPADIELCESILEEPTQ